MNQYQTNLPGSFCQRTQCPQHAQRNSDLYREAGIATVILNLDGSGRMTANLYITR